MTDSTRRSFLQQTTGTMAAMALMPSFAAAAPRRRVMPVAVVGLGRQGRAIIKELQRFESVEIKAICDIDARRLAAGGRRAPGATTYDALDALLAAEMDVEAVFIATPTHLHREPVVQALEDGRHVYCEAPLAATVDDCQAIVDAANAAFSIFQAGLLGRVNPIYTLANDFMRSGAVRDVVTLRAQHHRKTSWRTPAMDAARDRRLNWRLDAERSIGLAGEIGTHHFDVLNWFANMTPMSVRGHGSIRHHRDGRTVADTIWCELRYPNGASALFDASLANSYDGTYELIGGTMGTIRLAWSHGWLFKEADAPTQGWEVYANRQQFHREEGITLIANATKLADQGKLKDGIGLPHTPLYYGIESFIDAVGNELEPAVTAAMAQRATVIGIRANEAIVSGTDVAINLPDA